MHIILVCVWPCRPPQWHRREELVEVEHRVRPRADEEVGLADGVAAEEVLARGGRLAQRRLEGEEDGQHRVLLGHLPLKGKGEARGRVRVTTWG